MTFSLNRYFMFFAIMAIVTSVSAAPPADVSDKKYISIKSMEVKELHSEVLESNFNLPPIKGLGLPNSYGYVDPQDKTGRVISVAKDLVALGEDLYRLVIKGKPSNATSYAPISVIPRVNGQPVDILDTESWKMPVKKTYEVIYKNYYGMDVVTFRYSIIFSYGGSYDGKGAYLTAVQIVPEKVRTLFGYDFTATMKLGGLQNQGTRANPIAAATILMEYTVSTVMVANNVVSSFFITGRGGFKKL